MIEHILFDVTNNCNYTCWHCYKNSNGKVYELPAEEFLTFIKNNELLSSLKAVTISGGEPFLYSELKPLLSGLSDYQVQLNTNGFFLDKQIGTLCKYKYVTIAVSLDGYSEETYRLIRNNDYFPKIIHNIQFAKSCGLNVKIQTRVTRATIDNYEEFIRLANNLDVPILLSPIMYTGSIRQKDLAMDDKSLWAWLEDMQKKNLGGYTNLDSILKKQSCSLLRSDGVPHSLVVDFKGRMFSCTAFRNMNLTLGSIQYFNENNFLERCRFVQQLFRKKLNCSKCRECGFHKTIGDGTCIVSCFLSLKDCAFDI